MNTFTEHSVRIEEIRITVTGVDVEGHATSYIVMVKAQSYAEDGTPIMEYEHDVAPQLAAAGSDVTTLLNDIPKALAEAVGTPELQRESQVKTEEAKPLGVATPAQPV